MNQKTYLLVQNKFNNVSVSYFFADFNLQPLSCKPSFPAPYNILIFRDLNIKITILFQLINLKRGGASIIYFIDDDLLDIRSLISLPLPYALRIFFKTTVFSFFLLFLPTDIYVSTSFLKRKYSHLKPKLIYPIAVDVHLLRRWIPLSYDKNKNLLRICYHGTWSHKNEIKWLVPIIREVQNRCSDTTFEIIGGDRVAKLFKGIPRVEVLETMLWPQYLEHTSNVRQDIGLAPLMDTLFNRGRGPIKFFDYSRAGAVGIYSKGPAFGDFVTDGVDGFLLDNDPQLWVEKIVELINNPELRQAMAHKAWDKVLDNSPAS